VESRSDAPSLSKRKVEWTHLPDGRWIERIVSTNNGTSYYPAFTNRYVWDGQVLLAVLNHTNGLELSFMRGLDLSGTPQGAGGVGGVLASQIYSNSQLLASSFYAYDGNGNVTTLVNAADGSESARYEYGPFAEPIRMTGPMARVNPIRFSTQYTDDVTGDVKYLFRDYGAAEGRWRSRDPIEETGGFNLYSFVENQPMDTFDLLGQESFPVDDGIKQKLIEGKVFRCNIVIYVGHNRAATPHVPKTYKISKCGYASVVACWSETIPVSPQIPGIDPRPDENTRINERQGALLAESDFNAGLAAAPGLCGSCCCSKVFVWVNCAGIDLGPASFSLKKICNRWALYDCKTKTMKTGGPSGKL
jgi:RHS repeat-associated protein